ncbi:TetR family transcriptional regulator [Lysinibacillus fusiformis ZB2]|nr:TetR family transcriptional regulator [Lysinibacillus fusiformis ZB2]
MGRDKKFSEQDLWHHTHQLLLSVGYQGFTMSLLAQSIGVSRAAIYKHNR